jgi:ubiquinone/menaquinone biosynthesis C-methylase UbiE
MSLKHLFKAVTVEEERQFERQNVSNKRERYLATNPIVRYAGDAVYKDKVDRVRAAISGPGGAAAGWTLDIGGNTAGEATILRHYGLNLIVGDINEAALDISRERIHKFDLAQPAYVAFDVHQIPFGDASIECVVVLEALHHFPDYHRALTEIHRVLKPGGLFYAQEPNGLNPLRRLSEVRDRLRGTVEKSFFRSQLRRLCADAGFERIKIVPGVAGRSSWKLQEVPGYRRWLAVLHGRLQQRFPRIFGPHELFAWKPGSLAPSPLPEWKSLLREPGGGEAIHFDSTTNRWRSAAHAGAPGYADLNGIPVLIRSDQLD